jgi:hypothetical protein
MRYLIPMLHDLGEMLKLDHPNCVSRRLVEIGDDVVLRGYRIDFALCDVLYPDEEQDSDRRRVC